MKEYLLKLFPKDSHSAELISEYLKRVNHDNTSTTVNLDELRAILIEVLKDFENGIIDYEEVAVLCDKLEILMRDVEGFRESRTSALMTELADIDWTLKDKSVNPKELVKNILAKY